MKDRKVGTESQKTYLERLENGFFDKYMSGKGLDIGFAGYTDGAEPILPDAIGIDINYSNYDGKTLPIATNSVDYIYSSHCLEHIADFKPVLQEWFRVVKVGGYIVITVPHKCLYEKKRIMPSVWNEDHKRFYTPASLLLEVELSLDDNSYRVRYLADDDNGYTYHIGPDTHAGGRYEITMVLEKIKKPKWELIG